MRISGRRECLLEGSTGATFSILCSTSDTYFAPRYHDQQKLDQQTEKRGRIVWREEERKEAAKRKSKSGWAELTTWDLCVVNKPHSELMVQHQLHWFKT